MSIGITTQKLEVTLDVKEGGHVQAIVQEIRKLQVLMDKTRYGWNELRNGFRAAGREIERLTEYARGFIGLFILYKVTGFFKNLVHDATSAIAQFQLLHRSLARIYTDAEQFDEVKRQINEVGSSTVGIANLERSMISLESVGIKPGIDGIKSLIGYLQSIGRVSPEAFSEVTARMTTMWGILNVGMDDAFKELNEKIPVLWTAMRYAMGVSSVKLMEEFRKQKITFQQVITSLFKYVKDNYSGYIEESKNDLYRVYQSLATIPELLASAIASSEAPKVFSKFVNGMMFDINQMVSSGEFSTIIERISNAFVEIIRQLGIDVNIPFKDWLRKFVASIEKFAKNQTMANLVNYFKDVVNGIKVYNNTIQHSINILNSIPDWAEYGIVGWMLFGKKTGIAIAAITGALQLADDVFKNSGPRMQSVLTEDLSGAAQRRQEEARRLDPGMNRGLINESLKFDLKRYYQDLLFYTSEFQEEFIAMNENFSKVVKKPFALDDYNQVLKANHAVSQFNNDTTAQADAYLSLQQEIERHGKVLVTLRSGESVYYRDAAKAYMALLREQEQMSSVVLDGEEAKQKEFAQSKQAALEAAEAESLKNNSLYVLYRQLSDELHKVQLETKRLDFQEAIAGLKGFQREMASAVHMRKETIEQYQAEVDGIVSQLGQFKKAYGDTISDDDLKSLGQMEKLVIDIRMEIDRQERALHGYVKRNTNEEIERLEKLKNVFRDAGERIEDFMRKQNNAMAQYQAPEDLKSSASINDQYELTLARLRDLEQAASKAHENIMESLQGLEDLSGINAEVDRWEELTDKIKKARDAADKYRKLRISKEVTTYGKMELTALDTLQSSMDGFVDSFVDGKASVKDFFKTLYSELMKALLKMVLVERAMNALKIGLGLYSTSSPTKSSVAPTTMAYGGITPGGSSQPQVTVNLIGQGAEKAEVSTSYSDIEGMIVDVVLGNINRHGALSQLVR